MFAEPIFRQKVHWFCYIPGFSSLIRFGKLQTVFDTSLRDFLWAAAIHYPLLNTLNLHPIWSRSSIRALNKPVSNMSNMFTKHLPELMANLDFNKVELRFLSCSQVVQNSFCYWYPFILNKYRLQIDIFIVGFFFPLSKQSESNRSCLVHPNSKKKSFSPISQRIYIQGVMKIMIPGKSKQCQVKK